MMTLGPLSFAFPAALLALVTLPALWWLLRVIPPAPLRVRFPPIRLIAPLISREQSAQRTPPWLLALRLALATAVILGMARPLLNAATPLPGAGPVVLVVDNGWAAAAGWSARQAMMASLIDRAERADRDVILLPTALGPGADVPQPPERTSAAEAREQAGRMEPMPWPTARPAAVDALLASEDVLAGPPAAIIWLSDGLDEPGSSRATEAGSVQALVEALAPLGAASVVLPEDEALAAVLRPPSVQEDRLAADVVRPAADVAAQAQVRALSEDGEVLARQAVSFAVGTDRAEAVFVLPTELRNRIARLEMETGRSAASVVLLDERWRRRPVGIVTGRGTGSELPLLSESYYLARGLEPSAEVRRGSVDDLLGRELAVLVLVDAGILDEATRQKVQAWVEDGGVLLRFAGPRLASGAARDDLLLPTPLRLGDRVLGGAMSWREPARLAPFPDESPFAGLDVPEDVEVRRQVLAQPSIDLERGTWARLDDGTPLVTAARRGDGFVVLVHTTANADWSTLPLSGLFVAMLERIVGLSRGAVAEAGGPPLEPVNTLNGFGRLGPPPAQARAIAAEDFADTAAGPLHPPGFYGGESRRRALNLSATLPDSAAIGALPAGVDRISYQGNVETDLRSWFLGAALVLAVIDLAVSMGMRGLMPPTPRGGWRWLRRAGAGKSTNAAPVSRRRAGRAGSAMLVAIVAAAGCGPGGSEARAQEIVADGTAIPETLTTRLAYLRTGDSRIDEVSRAGLAGLTMIVNRRTAAELGEPVAVDPARDDLAFYPLIYWPLVPETALPSATAARALRDYMANGGTIVFDARNRGSGGATAAGAPLRDLARVLEIPPLTPVPADHVLGRSYYLLSRYPGRWTGQVWVERTGEHVNDGVTSVIAGGNDWAGAWAMDESQRPMFAVVPGAERQREQAFRFGINLLMHVLTGNYKADQVHLPTILERLGR